MTPLRLALQEANDFVVTSSPVNARIISAPQRPFLTPKTYSPKAAFTPPRRWDENQISKAFGKSSVPTSKDCMVND